MSSAFRLPKRSGFPTFPTRGRLLSSVLAACALIWTLPGAIATAEPLSTLWKRAVKRPVSLTVAPGGGYFGAVGENGTVRLYDQRGHLVWKNTVEGATDVLIAKNGTSMLVYSRLNPARLDVHFFRRDGRLLWKHRVEGSIWDGAVSPDGTHAAVGTGKRYLYLYTPDPVRPRYRRWRLDGIGHSVTFTPDSRRIVAGTWQESAVVCYDLRGQFQWRYKHDTDRQYELQTSADGRRILGVRTATEHDSDAELCLWDSSGKLLWRQNLGGSDPYARISPRSRYIAVSYTNYLTHKGLEILERRVAVYDSGGKLLWEKGGLFFSPKLVCLSPTGSSVIVSDGEQSFYNIDRYGKIVSKLSLGGTIRTCVPSDDSHRILVYCGDGWLYLIRVEV